MKYTRYDLKRRKSDNAILAVVLFSILLLAFLIGTIISNILIKNNEVKMPLPNPSSASSVTNIDKTNNNTNKFIVVQGGKFAKAENLEQAKKGLTDYGNPFTITEQDGTRLLLGIYNEEESLKVIKQLTDKKIENSKITFQLQTENDLCNEEIAVIINAELEVINKLSDKSIKSIQTDELKKWCSGLQETDLKSTNITVLNGLKTQINALPKDLTSDKVSESEIYIYNSLKKLTNK